MSGVLLEKGQKEEQQKQQQQQHSTAETEIADIATERENIEKRIYQISQTGGIYARIQIEQKIKEIDQLGQIGDINFVKLIKPTLNKIDHRTQVPQIQDIVNAKFEEKETSLQTQLTDLRTKDEHIHNQLTALLKQTSRNQSEISSCSIIMTTLLKSKINND